MRYALLGYCEVAGGWNMSGVCVITGGSSGIGKACAKKFSENGWRVYELSRSGSDFEGITHVTADVTDFDSVKSALREAYEKEGAIDVMINNAGFGISGAVEYTEFEAAEKQMKVNFLGVFNGMKAVAEYMRGKGGGKIVNVSSVAGVLPIPFQAFYSASKAALNALTLTFANEVRPFGIKVCAVMPGDVKTGFTAARVKNEKEPDDAYGDRIVRSVETMEKDEKNGMSCEYIAGRIYKVAVKRSVKPLYTLGGKYKLFTLLGKILPSGLVNRILYLMYSK